MKLTYSFCLLLAFTPVLACGDDGGGGSPDSATPNPDAAVVDAANNPDASNPDASNPDAMVPDAIPPVGIAAARAAADGAGLSLPIVGAYVTYMKQPLGADPIGFFIQAEVNGPALFIAIDPTTLDPSLAVGDEVSFTITEKGTVAGLRQALAVTSFTIDSSGFNVASLIQNVNDTTDLVLNLDDYDSELISFDATIIGGFADAGFPGRAAPISTVGYPTGDADLLLRVPDAVETSLELVNGCQITVVGTPLWRSGGIAEPSAWSASEIAVNSCPAPTVVSAMAADATTVVVTFDRNIDPATVAAGDFTFNLGLTSVSIVSVVGNVVTVETIAQTAAAAYVVTVNTLTDMLGTSIDVANNTANFVGFGEGACDDQTDNDGDGAIDCLDKDCSGDAACNYGSQLYLWEMDADQPGGDSAEFVEIYNASSSTIDLAAAGIFLLFVNGSDRLVDNVIALTGTVAAGDVYVVGMVGVTGVVDIWTFFLQNSDEGIMLVACTGCTVAHFPDNIDPTPSGGTFTVTVPDTQTVTVLDAMAYDTNDPDDTALWAALGVTMQFSEGPDANSNSLIRTSLTGWAQLNPPDPDNTGIQP